MTLDSIVALIGLLIAAYQIMPRWRQLDLAFRFRWLDWAIVFGAGSVLVYFQFFAVFAALGWTPRWGLSRWNMTPPLASFIVVILTGTVLAIRLRKVTISPARIDKFAQLAEELEQAREYPALFTILDRYLDHLAALTRRRKSSIETGTGAPDVLDIVFRADSADPEQPRTSAPRFQKVKALWAAASLRLRQSFRKFSRNSPPRTSAREVLDRLLGSQHLLEAMIELRPYLGVRILRAKIDRFGQFLTPYLRQLLRTPNSALYRELRNYQGDGEQDIFEEDQILFAFLDDPRVAEKLAVYKPIGDEMLATLVNLQRMPRAIRTT